MLCPLAVFSQEIDPEIKQQFESLSFIDLAKKFDYGSFDPFVLTDLFPANGSIDKKIADTIYDHSSDAFSTVKYINFIDTTGISKLVQYTYDHPKLVFDYVSNATNKKIPLAFLFHTSGLETYRFQYFFHFVKVGYETAKEEKFKGSQAELDKILQEAVDHPDFESLNGLDESIARVEKALSSSDNWNW